MAHFFYITFKESDLNCTTNTVRKRESNGGHNSSVDSAVPTLLWSQVRIPSTPFTLYKKE